jgi:energy-coupling factor transporter ATP-binding protein EcfA2
MTVLDTLKISRFRNVEPGTTLRFREGFNILLGKNATGKTTLLELIANAISLDLAAYAKEPFKIEFQLSANKRTIRVEAENTRLETTSPEGASVPQVLRTPELSAQASILIEEEGRLLLHYSVQDAMVERQTPGHPTTQYPLRVPLLDSNLLLPVLFAESDKRSIPTDFSLIGQFYRSPLLRFDESLAFFQTIIADSAVHVFIPREGNLQAFSRIAPKDVATAVAGAVTRDRNIATVPIENLPLLERLNSLLGFRTAVLYAERLERTAATEDELEQAEYGNFRFEFTRHDGSVIDHTRLSYGQKRLLAFHFWLATFDDFAVSDELVNGLHHAWISSSVEALANRQSFLTTQNPLLLDYLQFNSEQNVADSFIVCRHTTVVAGPLRMQWTNIGERDAHAFYRAYKAGIENVSEILVSRGLW